MPLLIFLLIAAAVFSLVVWRNLREARRADFIRGYSFPKGLIDKLLAQHPGLGAGDGQLVARALRHFFLAHLKSGRQFVSMPSKITDDLWHEFILYTRHYEVFCRQAFGRFMHHTPAVVLAANRRDNAGLRRTWWHCCKEENINPARATRLPLLFAVDAKLGVAGGFRYATDCAAWRDRGDAAVYCAGDFSSSSVDGGTDGFGDGSDGAGGASDGGGGGGDGGGCGGGGD